MGNKLPILPAANSIRTKINPITKAITKTMPTMVILTRHALPKEIFSRILIIQDWIRKPTGSMMNGNTFSSVAELVNSANKPNKKPRRELTKKQIKMVR